MTWQPIETAPKDGTKVDLWAKCWLSHTDTFTHARFTDCYWRERFDNSLAQWINLGAGYAATHWMPLPGSPTEPALVEAEREMAAQAPPGSIDIKTANERELLEIAWGIIANASGGDWSKENQMWQDAAVAWRDRWLELPPGPTEGPRASGCRPGHPQQP